MGIVEDTAELAETETDDWESDTDLFAEDEDGNEDDEFDVSGDGVEADEDEDPLGGSDEDDGDAAEDDGDDGSEPLFTIKVGGVEREVTQTELIELAQKGDDYTRKTQQLAEDRKRVAAWEQLNEAFGEDPEGTLRALAKQFDITLDSGGEQDFPEGFDPDDPLEREVVELRRELQSLKADRESEAARRQEADAAAQVAAELDAVRTKYEAEFDDEELLAFAIEHKIGSVEGAYLAWEASQARANGEPAQRQRKRTAPPVEGGRSRNKRLTKPGPSRRMSVEEALDAAIQSHRG